jgi:hypothetical protein
LSSGVDGGSMKQQYETVVIAEELGKLAYQIMELQFENRMLRAKILGVNRK